MQIVKSYFPPEFINRIDDLIVFKPLSRDTIENIIDIQLNDVFFINI